MGTITSIGLAIIMVGYGLVLVYLTGVPRICLQLSHRFLVRYQVSWDLVSNIYSSISLYKLINYLDAHVNSVSISIVVDSVDFVLSL